MHGARNSLLVAVASSISSCLFGCTLGAIAGYFGGKVDMLIMRALDIFMSIPDLLFTMVVVAALGSSIPVLIIAMTLAYFTNYVRLVRSGVLNLVDQGMLRLPAPADPVLPRIIISHIIPNTLGIILVNVTLNVSSLVIYQSTLSFIGLSCLLPHLSGAPCCPGPYRYAACSSAGGLPRTGHRSDFLLREPVG